jgi:putative solute:sodium symporter small subunit
MQNEANNGDTDVEVYHHQADNLPAHGAHDEEVLSEDRVRDYWRANVRLLLVLLAVWFTVSCGFGILLVDWLNRVSLFGFKLGFWWAQQGSIYVFVILIFVYVVLIGRIDRKFGVDDSDTAGDGFEIRPRTQPDRRPGVDDDHAGNKRQRKQP